MSIWPSWNFGIKFKIQDLTPIVMDRSARIEIDGVETLASVRAITRWGIGSGCAEFIGL